MKKAPLPLSFTRCSVEQWFAIIGLPCKRASRAVAASFLDFKFEVSDEGEESPNTEGQRAR